MRNKPEIWTDTRLLFGHASCTFYFYTYVFNDDQVEMILAGAITNKKFIFNQCLVERGLQDTRGKKRPSIYQIVIRILHKSTIIEGDTTHSTRLTQRIVI
jgi:hypothetical protein